MSRLDQFYRKLLLTKFFTKGWGNPTSLKRLFEVQSIMTNRDKCKHVVPSDYPIHIDKEELSGDCRLIEGHFLSPFEKMLPGIMPKEVKTARFQMLFPIQWRGNLKPTVLHLAGTGDHHFNRRRFLLARPLLKEYGIASIILENPYYGVRKPPAQLRSSLHNVSDLFVMGGALICESVALFHWCERNGYGPLGISGLSMGGHMASIAATNWDKPLSLTPCLSWSTASNVFTQGVMSGAIPWHLLESQYVADNFYKDEVGKFITDPNESLKKRAFILGKEFAENYEQNVDDLEKYHQDYLDDKATQAGIHEIMNMSLRNPDPRDDTSAKKKTVVRSDIGEDQSDIEATTLASDNQQGGVQASRTLTMAQNLTSDNNQPAGGEAPDSKRSLSASGTLKAARNRTSGKNSPAQASASYSTVANEKKAFFDRFDFRKKSKEPKRTTEVKGEDRQMLKAEVLGFMRGIMDQCTHLVNFSVPVDPSLVIVVSAEKDAYMPRDKVIPMQDIWPGVELRYLKNGHIGSFLFHQADFRKAIHDSMKKQIDKYYPDTIEAYEGLLPYKKTGKKKTKRAKS
ncbi:protein ABHD18-like [Lineus longissimus]|uniref:protein ABHD18-like n=1 Tax=Lineus longissimus TaxID=88925 RepID=UPI002B4DCDF0